MPHWLSKSEASFFKIIMKLFPDVETRKRFMKTGLPVIAGIAWSPIIWIVVLATLGPGLFALTGSWFVAQAITIVITVLLISFLLRAFMRIGTKFYSEGK
jgi:hypothetical protein